jgi:hypothetical protein
MKTSARTRASEASNRSGQIGIIHRVLTAESTEICLLGRRGKPRVNFRAQRMN